MLGKFNQTIKRENPQTPAPNRKMDTVQDQLTNTPNAQQSHRLCALGVRFVWVCCASGLRLTRSFPLNDWKVTAIDAVVRTRKVSVKKKAPKVEPGSLSLHADRSPAFKIPLNKLSEIHSTLHQERLAHSRFHSWYEGPSPAYTDAVHNCGFASPIQFSSWSLQSAQ